MRTISYNVIYAMFIDKIYGIVWPIITADRRQSRA